MPGWQAGYALARSALPRMPRRYATLMPAAVIYPARPGEQRHAVPRSSIGRAFGC